jgi:hypothetical protein
MRRAGQRASLEKPAARARRADTTTFAVLLALLCLVAPSLVAQASPAKKPQDLYRRVVTRALARAQAEVTAALDLDVDHSSWEDPWIVTTPHFEVRATRSYSQTLALADGLEFVRGELVKRLGAPELAPGRQRIWVFPTMADYNRFGEENGAEHSSMLGSFYAAQHAERPVVSYQNGNQTLLGMWVTHSAVHQLLEQGYGQQRITWVDEGLASYFALFWDWSFGASELERIEKTRSYVALERLVQEPLQAYAAGAHERFIELGMLFHFLLNSCEATKNGATGDPSTGPFQEFLRAAVRGEAVEDFEFAQTLEEAAPLLEEDFKAFDFAAALR